MTTEEFNRLVHERCEKIQAVLAAKSTEYARGDRLSNFKRAAAMMQETPERACAGMMAKHLVSVLDMIDDIDAGVSHSIDIWNEKLCDSMNYFILLEGLIHERNQVQEKNEAHQPPILSKRSKRR